MRVKIAVIARKADNAADGTLSLEGPIDGVAVPAFPVSIKARFALVVEFSSEDASRPLVLTNILIGPDGAELARGKSDQIVREPLVSPYRNLSAVGPLDLFANGPGTYILRFDSDRGHLADIPLYLGLAPGILQTH